MTTRREWLEMAGGAAGLMLTPRGVRGWVMSEGQEAAGVPAGGLVALNRFPRMVQEYFVERVREVERAGVRRKERLRTKADALAYVREARARIRACFGEMPERTPLAAKVTGVVERESYRIEKVTFESRPGFVVTANLYLPKGRSGRLPGVVATCGHSDTGKSIETYQSFVQGLARLGYVALIIDPAGQGERLQYPDEEGRSRIGAGVREHLHLGNQQLLVGENLPFWRAWDAIRAHDYLRTREEVDPERIGVTGNSGGGTVTTWVCGLDDRWAMAAPGCFVTTMRRNIENELPQDSEQYPPGVLAAGLDHDDFIAAMAPKPVILLAKEKDYFDVRGTEEAYGRLKRLYGLLGAERNIGIFVGPTYHGYTQENREAMYRWFNRVTKVSTATTEPEIVPEKDETLRVTPEGQVARLGSRTVFSFTAEKARSQARRREERGELSIEVLRREVEGVLRLPARQGVADARILREIGPRGYPTKSFTTYAIETEPGIQAIVYRLSEAAHYSRPSSGRKRAVLYVAHLSSDEELRREPLLREVIAKEAGERPGADFYACDVRGIGESKPETAGENQFLPPYGSDYLYAGHSLMLGYPYAGQKTFDVLRVLDWLESYGHTEVHLVAMGRGAIPATFAAVMARTVKSVTLKNALTSYTDLAVSEYYRCPLSCIVPGILSRLDLPDCYRALGARLRQIEPVGWVD